MKEFLDKERDKMLNRFRKKSAPMALNDVPCVVDYSRFTVTM